MRWLRGGDLDAWRPGGLRATGGWLPVTGKGKVRVRSGFPPADGRWLAASARAGNGMERARRFIVDIYGCGWVLLRMLCVWLLKERERDKQSCWRSNWYCTALYCTTIITRTIAIKTTALASQSHKIASSATLSLAGCANTNPSCSSPAPPNAEHQRDQETAQRPETSTLFC